MIISINKCNHTSVLYPLFYSQVEIAPRIVNILLNEFIVMIIMSISSKCLGHWLFLVFGQEREAHK